ncbi:TPA: hypothetical protein DCR49_05400 [Candidatus Delongbacteria bacterium]|nr:hypothetical protein [Candidatus Delongbacteria bacterium]
MKRSILVILMLLIATLFSETVVKDGYSVITDKLEGSKVTIAVPEKLSGNLLLLAHGYRIESADELSSNFSIDGVFAQKLISQGWIIGSTSYRRNGVILSDAVEDIEFLKKYIEDKYGKSDNVYLKGGSMGGLIITLMAEKTDNRYKGAMAIGAALTMQEENKKIELTHAPQIPILFLTNQSELKKPQDYIAQYKGVKFEPVLWKVKRDGHCNTNGKEELEAFEALVKYADTGSIEKEKELLIEMSAGPSKAVFRNGKAYAEVLSVDKAYGSVYLDLRKEDYDKLGIKLGQYYEIGTGNKNWRIKLGTTYSDVPYNFWVSFFEADGKFKVARNFRNAARPLGCSVGDTFYIKASDMSEEMPMSETDKKMMEMNDLSIQEVLKKDYAKALEIAYEIAKMDTTKIWPHTNIAHFLALNGKFDEAEIIYRKYKGTKVHNGSFYFEDTILDDFDDLKQMNLYIPEFDKIKKLYLEEK